MAGIFCDNNNMKRLFESYKDYFRIGAAISGIILMNDEEKAAHFEQMKARYEETVKYYNSTKRKMNLLKERRDAAISDTNKESL